jgi:hypothetical protein
MSAPRLRHPRKYKTLRHRAGDITRENQQQVDYQKNPLRNMQNNTNETNRNTNNKSRYHATSTSSPDKMKMSFPLKSTITSHAKPSFDISNFNIEDEDNSENLEHPFIGRKTGATMNSATLLKTTLKLRNENFELKQELEKANNFR